MKKALLLLPILMLALAGPATASPEQAAALRDTVTNRLGESAVSNDRLRVERVPDVTVSEAGGQYRLRIPKLRLAANDGWMVEAPLVEGDGTPQADGSWRLKLKLSQPLTLYGANGFRLGDIALGRQNLILSVSGDGRSLIAADIDLGEAKFTPAMGAGTGSLAALRFILTPRAATGGTWSGQVSLSLDGLSVKDPMGVDRLAVNRLRLDASADALDMTRMGALMADGDRANLDRLARGIDISADIAGLRQVRDNGTRTLLDSAKGKLSLTGLNAAKAGLVLDWVHEGLDHTGPGIDPGLLPTRAELALTGTSLPRELLTGAKPPGGWTPLLASSGSNVRIGRLSLWNAQSTVLGKGDFRFSTSSANGVTGEADLALRGVDRIIGAVNQTMGARGAGLAIGLYALQGLGRQEVGEKGTTLQYRLTMGNDGRVILNGSDATSLFKGMMAFN
ncbi:hypothetical protein [Niveispirillum sp. KHB5.9]|uniref:hypothetical protein n=1 Tax=Niveispirillum sp. KHB5.9 TaxID=3400269 RepID=UPI003A854B92